MGREAAAGAGRAANVAEAGLGGNGRLGCGSGGRCLPVRTRYASIFRLTSIRQIGSEEGADWGRITGSLAATGARGRGESGVEDPAAFPALKEKRQRAHQKAVGGFAAPQCGQTRPMILSRALRCAEGYMLTVYQPRGNG
jgi:hypothetical protein